MIAYERIKKLAKEQHFSNLQAVAKKAGIAKNLIYSWKKKQPTNDSLKAVAIALHTTTDYLNGLTDNPSLPTDNSFSLDDDKPVMYHGYNVPDKYLDMIRGLMDADIKEGKANKHE